ncbi:MAG TPA: MMPL family transporter [Aggregatilineaceae bacterium]|nr:MMPL family transporter [Aggregatilineaceae bacterium]
MFFERLGHFATRYRYPIIFAWVAAAAIITLIAPSINEVASSDQADFLPDDAPFLHAAEVYKTTFPDSFSDGSTLIIIDARQAENGIDHEEVQRFLNLLTEWLTSDDAPNNISKVVSPTTSAAAAALMIDDQRQVAMIRVSLSTTNPEPETTQTIETIDEWLKEHRPAEIKTYQTGEGPVVNDTTESVKTSVDRTIWVTIVLVILMLLLVYRSPVSPFIPLMAVTIAYLIARGIVAFMGEHLMTITTYANVMLVVIMYGAGTDYCLFLISRFREEMAEQRQVGTATNRTVHLVGETITSSAGTIFVGFMAMAFAEMGIFNTSGPALAVGVVLSLLAGLTFTPALLAVLGEHAFWPGQAKHRATGRFYELTSKQVSTRPLITILIIVAVMLPFSIYGLGQRVTYNLLADLPDDKDAVVGYDLLSETLGPGVSLPMTVVVTGREPDTIAPIIVHLTDELAALDGVADVRGLNSPLGQGRDYEGLLRVDQQLELMIQNISSMGTGEDLDLTQAMDALDGFKGYLGVLVEKFPVTADDPNMIAVQDLINNPMQLMSEDGMTALETALRGLQARFDPGNEEAIPDPYLMPTVLNTLFAASGDNIFGQLAKTYVTEDETAFKLDVILAGRPTSYEGMDTVGKIRATLEKYKHGGDAVAAGGPAVNTDIRDTMDRDTLRAIGFVLAGIFIVLLVMLRSVVAPLYLICTVLLSFTCTLGLTNLFFKTLYDVEGLTWYVPFFMFVFLVALGMDYSIFLFGRIKEEVGSNGIREGVHVAVARTGAIITSAGMILAGTFAAMVTGEILGLAEVGFAVAIGVLIDTFVVRTMLDPALATFFGRWTWWPGGVPKAHPTRQTSDGRATAESAD